MPSSLLLSSPFAPLALERHYHHDDEESSCEDVTSSLTTLPKKKKDPSPSCSNDDDQERRQKNALYQQLWKQRLSQSSESRSLSIQDLALEYPTPQDLETILTSLKQVVVLNPDDNKCQAFLTQFDGKLVSLSRDTTNWLEQHAPSHFSARVADFNDNLFYAMQPQRGLDHLVGTPEEQALCHEFEALLKETLQTSTLDYQGSYMTTESTNPQPAHVDFSWETLADRKDNLTVGFFPLTEQGCFLQVWPRNDDDDFSKQVEGTVVFIPYGQCLILPSHTIHGGGFRSLRDGTLQGNLRFHLYMASHDSQLPTFQNNKYTEEFDKGRELADRYVNAPNMEVLEEVLFE